MEAVRHLLKSFPNVMLSIVADSYDVHKFVEALDADLLKSRKIGCPIVVRPDSGEPEVIVLDMLNALHKKLGDEVRTNEKGFKASSFFAFVRP
jgi:nicotinic acid phosphoribosyltransferase